MIYPVVFLSLSCWCYVVFNLPDALAKFFTTVGACVTIAFVQRGHYNQQKLKVPHSYFNSCPDSVQKWDTLQCKV